MKKGQGKLIAGGGLALLLIFGFVIMTGGTDRFIRGNVQTFSLTQDFGDLNCEMWNSIAVTREGGLKVTVDSSRMEGFVPFVDIPTNDVTDGSNKIEALHFQLYLTCKGTLMSQSDAVTVSGDVDALICGDPISGSTNCLVGDNRVFSGDLRNAQDFTSIRFPTTSLPDDEPIKVGEWTISAEEIDLEYTSDSGKIFFESKMFPDWDFTFNHPTQGVFTASYNSGQQNDVVIAQYGDLSSTTSSNNPDTDFDGDGINDVDDLCPTQPETFNGFQDLDGCPDTLVPPTDSDGDGILDNDDACDFQAEDGLGLFPFDGCPISADECPNLQTLFNGKCVSDSDNDGTPDSGDNCPFDAGTAEFNGCPPDDPNAGDPPPPSPDGDGDGVPDNQDQCPTVGGNVGTNGCPIDTDGDGVPDDSDLCPTLGGSIVTFEGCPISCNAGTTWNIALQQCTVIELPPPDCISNPTLTICQEVCELINCEDVTDDDSDGDGIPDDVDVCANLAEDFDGVADEDGCPETEMSTPPSSVIPIKLPTSAEIAEIFADDRTIFIIILILGALIAVFILGRFKKVKF